MGIKKLAKRGGINANVYPHRFRHTYACQLLDNGAPLEFIQGMLGHGKASTTQIYAQLRGERRRELYRRYF
nr:tyrosine-type recombinase/integrase [Paenibacillus qinlingensis]